ncbi:MAG: Ig-like domain-containing protein [Bacteroidota bacterium]
MKTRTYITPLLLLFVSCWIVSCGSKQSPEGFAVTSVALDVPPEAATAFNPTLEGPLRPLSVAPSGTLMRLQPNQSISITFSQPMVALGANAPAVVPEFSIEPAINGTFRWDGTHTLVFQPATPLPMATGYEVSLAPGMQAVSGDVLSESFSWQFETPRPRLLHSDPATGDQAVATNQSFRLYFNQALNTAQAAGFVTLHQQNDRNSIRAAITVESDSVLVLTPDAPLQQGQGYEIAIRYDLPSARGPLGAAQDAFVTFRTYRPLTLDRIAQSASYYEEITNNFDPAQGITLYFSTPVAFKQVRESMTMNPALPLPAGIESRDDFVSTAHRLPLLWTPNTQYTLSLNNLEDVYGQLLPSSTHRFRTTSYKPSVAMTQGLLLIEADQQAAIPLRVTNVASASYGLKKLSAAEVIPNLSRYDLWHNFPFEGTAPDLIPTDETLSLAAAENKPEVLPLTLDAQLTNGTGVVAVHLKTPVLAGEKQPRTFKAIAQVSHMGISAKFSPHQNLIFVTTLADAAPVAGARVTIRDAKNTVQWEGQTDAEGRAQSPGWYALGMAQPDEWTAPTQYVFVERNDDLAFTSSTLDDGLEPYRYGISYAWNPEPLQQTGTVFTDRGLYKAGETAHFKGILRQKTDGEWTPITDSIRVLIQSPLEEKVFETRLLPSALGTFNFEWTGSENDDLGSYLVRVVFASDEEADTREQWDDGDLVQSYFRVDAFRRATFNVEMQASTASYIAGDFFEGTTTGRYLFGAPMQNQPVRYTLYREFHRYNPPGFDAYRFGKAGYDYSLYQSLTTAETTLDDAGQVSVRTQLPGNEQGQTARLVWNAEVTDPARQTGAARREITLHPGLFYIGLKPQTTFLDLSTEEAMTFDVIAINPGGVPVAAADIEVELVRRQWNSVREVGSDGRLRWRTEQIEENHGTQTLSIEAGRAQRLTMPVSLGGSYLIRAKGRDLRGNAIQSEAYFYATGSGYVAWERSDDDRINLTPERPTYAPGETAKIMVQSPYETAQALITVEREGIISSRVETLVGSAPQIEIPITEAHLPNIYVSVMLLNGRTAPPQGAFDAGAPSFKMGYTALGVDAGVRHLSVAITANETTYEPGEEVTVDLQLKNAAGQGVAGEIAFSAADAGVLNLIGYTLPDPFDTFYGARPLGVNSAQSLANLVRQRNYGQKEEDEGGGGGDESGSNNVRKDFRPLAHWEPAIQTDNKGRARVTFKLPESLTTFRLMAVGLTGNNLFGAGAEDIVVTKPLVLAPALPRFARLGDEFEAGVLITNTTGNDGSSTVSVSANGLALTGDSEQTVSLADGETKEVRFKWNGTTTGAANLTFSAGLNRESDAFAIDLPILLPTIKEQVATFASTEDNALEALQLPPNIIPGMGKVEAHVASTALVGIDGAARYLFTYPYGCLEQRTSRIRPLIAGDALLNAFDLDVVGGDRDSLITDWANSLKEYWMGNGFSLWRGSYYVNPYVSSYVVLTLADARDAGFDVPEALTRLAVEALARQVRNASQKPEYYGARTWNDARAFSLFALARHGVFLESEINQLVRTTVQNNTPISVDGRSHLLRTLWRSNNDGLKTYQQALYEDLIALLRVEGTSAYLTASQDPDAGWIFASDTRSTAYGLTALIEASEDPAFRTFANQMIRYLINTRQASHWASTQENAAVVDAFALFQKRYEADAPDFTAAIQVAGKSLLEQAFKGVSTDVYSASIPLQDLPTDTSIPVDISKEGTGSLYYALSMESYRSGPVAAQNQGLSVSRTFQLLDNAGQPYGSVLTTGGGDVSLEAGQLVRVTLRLNSPADRNYLVVEDPLPAGLEPVNDAFATANQEYAAQSSGRWWGSFNHTEMHDDKVLLFADYLSRGEHTHSYVARATVPGTFVHPPARSELMYEPEVNGRNASGRLVVTAPSGNLAGQ